MPNNNKNLVAGSDYAKAFAADGRATQAKQRAHDAFKEEQKRAKGA